MPVLPSVGATFSLGLLRDGTTQDPTKESEHSFLPLDAQVKNVEDAHLLVSE
jgi:hypothetical protein